MFYHYLVVKVQSSNETTISHIWSVSLQNSFTKSEAKSNSSLLLTSNLTTFLLSVSVELLLTNSSVSSLRFLNCRKRLTLLGFQSLHHLVLHQFLHRCNRQLPLLHLLWYHPRMQLHQQHLL